MQSKGFSRVSSNTTVQKHQFFSSQPSLLFNSQIHTYIHTGKTIALTRRTYVGKVMSLLFNMQRFVIAFLPGNKCLNFNAPVTNCSDYGAQENKVSHCVHYFPIYCHEGMGPDAMIFIFACCFKPAFSLSSFTFIKRFFSSSLLSAIRMVSSAQLRLLRFFLAILIPAFASSSPAFHTIYSACKLNKQSDSI